MCGNCTCSNNFGAAFTALSTLTALTGKYSCPGALPVVLLIRVIQAGAPLSLSTVYAPGTRQLTQTNCIGDTDMCYVSKCAHVCVQCHASAAVALSHPFPSAQRSMPCPLKPDKPCKHCAGMRFDIARRHIREYRHDLWRPGCNNVGLVGGDSLHVHCGAVHV